jgi:DUF971 family protein
VITQWEQRVKASTLRVQSFSAEVEGEDGSLRSTVIGWLFRQQIGERQA